MPNTTGHAEAIAQIEGETGRKCEVLHGILVYSDGRTEHVSWFAPSDEEIIAPAEPKDDH